jgi:hypothetical protein
MPGTMWAGIASTLGRAEQLADERERTRKADAEAKQLRAIQMAATLAGLSGQGISQNPGEHGTPLGQTGYYQDPSQTPRAMANAAANLKRSQRIAALKRNPDLTGYGDDELAGIADDDASFEKWTTPKPPKKKDVKFDAVSGRPVIYDADDPQFPSDFVGPHTTPPNPASVVGSPAWKAAQEYTAGLGRRSHEADRKFDIGHPMPQQDGGKMTEFSNKAALVYPRAAEAAALLDPFFDSGVPAVSLLGRATFGQYGVDAKTQRANQAAETISSAILRLESGAAISEHEVKEYAKQFLPQPGDSKELLKQKRATLKTQLERMRQAATPTMSRDKASPIVDNTSTSTSADPEFDALMAKAKKRTP